MDSVISGAEKLFLRGKYSKVLRMLEPQVFQFRDSYRFYLLLGYSCLHTGDFGGGYSYLRRAEQLSPGDISTNLGIALILSKRGETEAAIRIWLDILEKNEYSREAGRGLKLIREAREFSEITIKLEDGKIDRYLSYPKRKKKKGRFFIIAASLLILFSAVLFIKPWKYFTEKVNSRPEIADVDFFSETSSPGTSKGNYVLTEEELSSLTEKILDLMNNYRDNLAQVEINRLILSDAPETVKEKGRYLTRYIKTPGFGTLKDNFKYTEVMKNPDLYRGCFVVWSGKAANVIVNETMITFDLLVGYDSETVLDGIVPVTLDFPVQLEENKSLELLGKILISSDNKNGVPVIALKGISIHQLISN